MILNPILKSIAWGDGAQTVVVAFAGTSLLGVGAKVRLTTC